MNRYATIVIPNRKVFLSVFHLKSGTWRFPGGKMEEGEMSIAAAARELKEELGIEPRSLVFLETVTHPADGETWTGDWYLCEDYVGIPRIQEPNKHSDLRYLSVDDLAVLNSHPEHEICVNYLRGFNG